MISVTIQRESAKVLNIKRKHSYQCKLIDLNNAIAIPKSMNNYNANENYMNWIKLIEYKWNL